MKKEKERMTKFKFNDYGTFTDGEIEVFVQKKNPANKIFRYAPSYDFTVQLRENRTPVGSVSLRIGNSKNIVTYMGHIGYSIDNKHRGHHYAAKACNLIKPVALDYDLKTLWITCTPNNHSSRRTCEILGCELVEIIDMPEYSDRYRSGERQMCRYRWDIGE